MKIWHATAFLSVSTRMPSALQTGPVNSTIALYYLTRPCPHVLHAHYHQTRLIVLIVHAHVHTVEVCFFFSINPWIAQVNLRMNYALCGYAILGFAVQTEDPRFAQ